MRRCLALFGLTAALGVSGVYGQEPGKNGGQKAEGQKVPVEGVKTPPSPGKTNATGEKKVIEGVQIQSIVVKEGQPIAETKIIVLDENFKGVLPSNIQDYIIEIRDLSLAKLLATVKAGPVVLKDDVGGVRIGQIRLHGSALSSLVESLPDVVDGVEIKKTTGSQGGVAILGRTKPTAVEVTATASGFTQERLVIPVNFGPFFGDTKGDERVGKWKSLQGVVEMALVAKAGGKDKKPGSVEIEFHDATNLGLLSGKPQDLAFALTVLEALGIKTPAVTWSSLQMGYSGSASMMPPLASRDYQVSVGQGIKIPMVSGNPSGGGMMNPTIPMVSGQSLPGSNDLMNTQEIVAALKKNQERIAAMEATIRKLQLELETAKKGTGK